MFNITIITWILFIYLSLSVAYVFIFSIAGLFRKKEEINTKLKSVKNKIAILIPAYKEDFIIIPVVNSLLKLNYPKANYDIVVIADSLKQSTITSLKGLPIKVVEVEFEKSTKAKSLNYTLHNLKEEYDIALISDADNVMESDFLEKINEAYNQNHKIIQGRRVAKNLDTSFAILDAASEIINNHIFRKGFNALGLSASLIGSGMAFNYDLLKEKLAKVNAVGGFDRELQLLIVEEGYKIKYLKDAKIFDEKIENKEAFKNQRTRWLSSQFVFLRKYFLKGLKLSIKGNFDYFNLGIISNLFLSRVLTLGLLVITSLSLFFIPQTFFGPELIYWFILLFIYIFSLLIAIPYSFYDKNFFLALFEIPSAFLIMFLSLFQLKGANKTFIHTIHNKVEIDKKVLNKK